jgi:hypothetical protein
METKSTVANSRIVRAEILNGMKDECVTRILLARRIIGCT